LDPNRRIGQRISEHRIRPGRSQAVIAGLCGITEDYLSRIERGVKTPTLQVLIDIARELRVPVGTLIGDTTTAPSSASEPQIAKDVAQALLGNLAARPELPTPRALRERVEAAWRIWQTSPRRFSEAAVVLSSLRGCSPSAKTKLLHGLG
jgi:transcriptional regulator with XRE-family HTH domain